MNHATHTRRVFRPGLVPTIVTLALLPVLLGLGFWQLGRYEYKLELWDSFRAEDASPLRVTAVTAAESERYRSVATLGSYLGERQFLIDNMVRGGRNGFFVLTPLELVDGDLLLVNRGWIPQDARRRPLADLRVDAGTREVYGRVGTLPVAGIDIPAEEPSASVWPSVRQFPDYGELAAALGRPVKPWVLLLSPEAGDGFVREWEPGGLPPSTHLGYAVQWFGLATALVVIYVLVNLKKRPISENT